MARSNIITDKYMGLKIFGDVVMLGNYAKIRKGRPKNIDKEYKAIVPFDFKWRATLGRAECDCVECLETYMPYYGYNWYHSDDCAIMKHFRKYPQMQNLGIDPSLIAMTD